jgi:Carboxypeptidase regulatory-like domain/Ankyrin repeats (3 copies)/Ankyrin repeat
MTKKVRVNAIEVKSPCSEKWSEMQGNSQVRFCSHCAHSVNDLSAMARKDAIRLIRRSEGRLCIRYIPDPVTRKPLFANNLYKITRRAPGLAAGVMTASITLATAAYAQEAEPYILDGPAVKVEKSLNADTPDTEKTTRPASTANLYGEITDARGAFVAGMPVSLIDEKTNQKITVTADGEGRYEFADVPKATYKLVFEGSTTGFREKSFPGLSISPDDNIRYNVSLDAGAVMGMIVSVAESPLRYALSQAVEDKALEKVTDLIIRHANVNAKEKDRRGITPLFIAIEDGNVEIAEVLLRFGAKVNVRDENRQTPLMMIGDDTPVELVDLLLKYGAKVDLEDDEGNTALLRAADMGADISIIRTLIIAGADVNHKNNDGETAWDLTGNDDVEKLLESYGGRSGDPEETDDDPASVSVPATPGTE